MATVVNALAEERVAIMPHVLADAAINALRSEAIARDAVGIAQQAGVGKSAARQINPDIRGDRIAWLDEERATPAERAYFAAMHELRECLNRELMTALVELEAHYAIYPPGARYSRHRDRFRDDDARVISVVLYLNDAWTARDGGVLRVYLPEDSALEVFPHGGTLVAFASDRFEHEVLPATRPRVAITGWFRRRASTLPRHR